MAVASGPGGEEMENYCLTVMELQFRTMKIFLDRDSDSGYTTKGMYLMPLKYIHKDNLNGTSCYMYF